MKKNKPLSDGMVAALFIVYTLLFFGGIYAGYSFGKDAGNKEHDQMNEEIYDLMEENSALTSESVKCAQQLTVCAFILEKVLTPKDGGD